MISDKGKYPFIMANTDSSEKPGVHWWSILDIEPKTDIFFFDSFGLYGLKHFIVQDDKPIVEQILLGVEKMTRTDNKITLCKILFNLRACKKLSESEIDSLSDTARNFFRFVLVFGIKLILRDFVNIWMVALVVISSYIFTIICSTLTKTAKYKTILNLQKKQSKFY